MRRADVVLADPAAGTGSSDPGKIDSELGSESPRVRARDSAPLARDPRASPPPRSSGWRAPRQAPRHGRCLSGREHVAEQRLDLEQRAGSGDVVQDSRFGRSDLGKRLLRLDLGDHLAELDSAPVGLSHRRSVPSAVYIP